MALQFIDSFDHYTASHSAAGAAMSHKWDDTSFAGLMIPDTDGGRFGGQGLLLDSTVGSAYVQKTMITDRDEVIVGFAFLPSATGSHTSQFIFNTVAAGTVTFLLSMGTGTASVSSSGGGSATSSSGVLTDGVWHFIELRAKVHSSAGELEIKVNEITVATVTGVDTGTTGDLVRSIRVRSTSNLQHDFIDDFYILDKTGSSNNDFLGDCRIVSLNVDADGDTNDFTLTSSTPSDVSNFEGVDELTSTTFEDYVESGLIGAREHYSNETLADRGISPSVIYGVQVVNDTLKTDVGTLKFRDEMTIAGTRYDNGVDVVAQTGEYHMSTFIRDTDPSDSATWTEAKVDAVGTGCVITVRVI